MFKALQNLQRDNDLLAACAASAILNSDLQPENYIQMEGIILTWQNAPDGKSNVFSLCVCFLYNSASRDRYLQGLQLNSRLSGYVYLDPEKTKKAFASNCILPTQFDCIAEMGKGFSPGSHSLIFIRK